MKPIDDPQASRMSGVILPPRLMYSQLDSALEQNLAEWEEILLIKLQARVLRKSESEWFENFLTIFVFLSALELNSWFLHTWENDRSVVSLITPSIVIA